MNALLEKNKVTTAVMTALAVTFTGGLLLNWFIPDKNRDQKTILNAIPTPKGGYPYIGHILSFSSLPPGFKFKEWHDELGPVIRVQMGGEVWICICDPEIAYQLLVSKGAAASNRANHGFTAVYNARGKKGIMMSDRSKSWKNLRAALLSITSSKSVNSNSLILERQVETLVENLVLTSSAEDGVDPLLPFKRSSLNFVLETCFGTSVHTSKNDILFERLITMLDEFTKLSAFHNDITNFFPFLSFINVLKRTRKAYTRYDQVLRTPVIRELIDHAVNSEKDCMFRRIYNEKESLELDDEDLLVAATDVIVAGTDTTAVSLSWTIAILLHHPDVCKKITTEVDAFIREHHRLPHFSERDAFPYLIAAQKEAMRFRGFAHLVIPHVLEENVTCCGFTFPKNVQIVPCTYAMHQSEDRFPKPEKFIPERFLNNTDTLTANLGRKVDSRDHYIFGWGRRACPGSYLAEAQMFSTMTRVFAKCTLELPSDGSLPDIDDVRDTGLVLQTPPFKVRFVPRTDCLLSHN